MSKYIKLEDAIHNINLEVIGRKEYTGDMKANLFFALDDLPTIEVSEDCISREEVCRAIITCGEVDNDLTHLYDVIENFPSVVLQVANEDCISKSWLKTELDKWSLEEGRKDAWDNWNKAIDTLIEIIDDAPSEVPKQVTGKLGDSVKSTDSTIEADFKEMRSKLAPTTEKKG